MFSRKTSHSARHDVSRIKRSILLSADAAWPPSSDHTGIRFTTFSHAPALASAAQNGSEVLEKITRQPAAERNPAKGPARLMAARVSSETPSERQRT